jgi:hypothetical protein
MRKTKHWRVERGENENTVDITQRFAASAWYLRT